MRPIVSILFVFFASVVASCGRQDAGGPPELRVGDSVCAQCNMIISDERWATATVVDGPRGAEPRLFDDFNCQVNYEAAHPENVVLARWSHDYSEREWVRTERAHFLLSPSLRAPMGSCSAAFKSRTGAEEARSELPGDVVSFDIAWKRLGLAGSCHDSGAATLSEEHDHGP